MKEILTGYCDPPIQKKGPRVKKEAYDNFLKNKGTFNNIIAGYGKDINPETHNPRNFHEGKSYNQKAHGSVGNLFANYGNYPISARPVSRVKFEGTEILENSRGTGVDKIFKMVPLTQRPSSTQFFNATYK